VPAAARLSRATATIPATPLGRPGEGERELSPLAGVLAHRQVTQLDRRCRDSRCRQAHRAVRRHLDRGGAAGARATQHEVFGAAAARWIGRCPDLQAGDEDRHRVWVGDRQRQRLRCCSRVQRAEAAELRGDREVLWFQHLPAEARGLAVLSPSAGAAHREAVTAGHQLVEAERGLAGAPRPAVEATLETWLGGADGEAELGVGRCRQLVWVHGDLGFG